jgi:hypothetical protein
MDSKISFVDRSRRLKFMGLLTAIAGVGFTILGLVHLALPAAAELVPSLRIDRAIVATGLLTYITIGLTLISCGIGSIRMRRWTRPAMLTVGWVWLLAGLMVFGYATANIDDLTILVGSGIEQIPPELERLLAAIVIAPLLIFGCVPPVLLLWIFRDEEILRTCQAHHPEPDWSDRCTTEVFVLALAMGYSGALTLPLALKPTLPWFGRLWSGPGASVIFVLLAGVLIWSGYALFRLRRSGWWATGIVTSLLGISSCWTLYLVPRADWYRALDYPEKMIGEILGRPSGPPWLAILAVAVMSLLTWLYLFRIRHHFTESSRPR